MQAFLWFGVLGPFLKRASTWALVAVWLAIHAIGDVATGGAGHASSRGAGPGAYDVALVAIPIASWLTVLALVPQRALLARSGVPFRLAVAACGSIVLAVLLVAVAAPVIDFAAPPGTGVLPRLVALVAACTLWGEVVLGSPLFRGLAGWTHAAGIVIVLSSGYGTASDLASFPARAALILPILGLCLALALQAPARSLHR